MRLSDATNRSKENEMTATARVQLLDHILYYQQVLLNDMVDSTFMRLLINQLYRLTAKDIPCAVRLLTVDVFRCLMLLQSTHFMKVLVEARDARARASAGSWEELMTNDSETFLHWLESQRADLDNFFLSDLGQYWVAFVNSQNKAILDRANDLRKRRKEYLKTLTARTTRKADNIAKYEATSSRYVALDLHEDSRADLLLVGTTMSSV